MSLYSLMITVFAVIFWIFRIVVTLTTTLKWEFFMTPLNVNVEIALLFITLFCLVFICRRKIIAALIYLLTHLGYFGVYLYEKIANIITGAIELDAALTIDLFFALIGIIIPFLIFLDIGFSNSSKKTTSRIKTTDWFYHNKKYDRQFDERADRNQYKF